MSRRQELLDAVKVEVDKIASSTVVQYPVTLHDARDRYSLPLFMVLYASEDKETAATDGTSNKQSTLELFVVVYVKHETDPLTAVNTQIENIEKEIEDDVKLGKVYPVFARVVRVEMDTLAEEVDESGGMRYGIGTAIIRINYRHERGLP